MNSLIDQGFVVLPGPFSSGELSSISEDFEQTLAGTSGDLIKYGSRSTRFALSPVAKPFCKIYLHPPLLKVVSDRIGAAFKLSSFFGRVLRPDTDAPPLHQDIKPGQDGDPLIGFILMVDAFTAENGATRFAPGSHRSASPARDEQQICGARGAMIVFDGLTWHEHGANATHLPRRCVQGYFIRSDHTAARRWSDELTGVEVASLGRDAQELLAIDNNCI